MTHTVTVIKEMRLFLWLMVLGGSWKDIVCPPVQPETVKPVGRDAPTGDDQGFGLEYDRYLQEVIMALEEDDSFRKKLEEMNMTDIKSGKIAMHLDLVSHQIREKLDEIKRQEMNRLRMLAMEKMKQMNDVKDMDDSYLHHVDVKNQHSFESKDLEKLIKKATMDLDVIDKKRRDEFKEYEMEKEQKHREELKKLDEEHRKAKEEEYEQMKKRHQEHPQVHHPGSKAQLEDVWEKSDKLDPDDFNPKTFFKMHDLDANGFLDQEEIEALFQKELDHVYDPNLPEDDMRERFEDMARMREHVFGELDHDKDQLISIAEFLNYTASAEFHKDDGWKTVDEQQNFMDEEYRQYEQMMRTHEEQMKMSGMDSNLSQPGIVHQGQDANVFHMQMQRGEQGALPVQQQQQQQQQYMQQQQQMLHHQQFQQQQLGQMGHIPDQVPIGSPSGMGQAAGQMPQAHGQPMQPGHVHMGQGQIPSVGAPQAQGQVPFQVQGQVPLQVQGQVPLHVQSQVPNQPQDSPQGNIAQPSQGHIPNQGGLPTHGQEPLRFERPQHHQQQQQENRPFV